MGYFGSLGNKLSGVARLGGKMIYNIGKIGNKVATTTDRLMSGLETVPVLGGWAKELTPWQTARGFVNLGRSVSQFTENLGEAIEKAPDRDAREIGVSVGKLAKEGIGLRQKIRKRGM